MAWMRRAVLLFIFFILLVSSAIAQSIKIIEIDENGSASWNIEKHIPITTPIELNEWKLAIEKGQDLYRYKKDIEEVKERINYSFVSAQNNSNRTMSIENFHISYNITETMSETLGIIHFKFQWKNFSRLNGSKILIGDSFSNGMLLSSNDVLIIQIPEGFDVESVSPVYDKRDVNKLVWDGIMYHEFKVGEPALVLAPIKPTKQIPVTWIYGIVLLIAISGISILFFIKKRTSYNDENNREVVSLHYDLPSKYLEDEEMIQQILLKYNGEAYQSDIVRESGLSKSKISNVLSDMKDQGLIIKIRKGRGNVIRLVKLSK
jgi:uncharacterized membrane protein